MFAFFFLCVFSPCSSSRRGTRKSSFGGGRGSRAPTGLRLRGTRHESSEGFGGDRASRVPTGTLLRSRQGCAGLPFGGAPSELRHNPGWRLLF